MWNFPLVPDQGSTFARRYDALFLFAVGVQVFFTLLVLVLVVAFAIRYRRGSKADRSHPPHSNNFVEATWIVIPLVLAMSMFAWGTSLFYEQFAPPGNAMTIYVTGKQWMWKLQHPEGHREINTLHIPVGRPVKLVMTSEDVIHSFFVPAFRVKQDVLPGRYTEEYFTPSKPGKYHLFCAEYCGTKHSAMIGSVYVMDPADYENWLNGTDPDNPSMAQEGQRLFVQNHCAGCHGASQTVHAPRLEGVYGSQVPISEGDVKDPRSYRFVTADARYIRDSILQPKAQVVAGYEPIMPSFAGQISEDDLLKVVEYIKSIGRKEVVQ